MKLKYLVAGLLCSTFIGGYMGYNKKQDRAVNNALIHAAITTFAVKRHVHETRFDYWNKRKKAADAQNQNLMQALKKYENELKSMQEILQQLKKKRENLSKHQPRYIKTASLEQAIAFFKKEATKPTEQAYIYSVDDGKIFRSTIESSVYHVTHLEHAVEYVLPQTKSKVYWDIHTHPVQTNTQTLVRGLKQICTKVEYLIEFYAGQNQTICKDMQQLYSKAKRLYSIFKTKTTMKAFDQQLKKLGVYERFYRGISFPSDQDMANSDNKKKYPGITVYRGVFSKEGYTLITPIHKQLNVESLSYYRTFISTIRSAHNIFKKEDTYQQDLRQLYKLTGIKIRYFGPKK